MISTVQEWYTDRLVARSLTPFLLTLLVLVLVSPGLVSAFAGFGGYISEKMLGDGTNEALYLGASANELTVL